MKEDRLKKKKKRIIKFWIRFAIVLIIAGAVVFCMKAPIFNVSEYAVTGNSYYTTNEILVMGNCKTGSNIFVGVDLKDIKKRLLNDAYMREVKVTRKFPATIEIDLDERHQIAALVYGEKFVVIDNEDMVLRKTSVDPKVTVIKGITLTKLNVGETAEVAEKIQLRQAIDLLNSMEANDMYFRYLEITSSGIKAYILDNLGCEGTVEDIIKALESGSIQAVTKDLFDKGIERGTIKVVGDGYISYSPAID